MTRPSTVHSVPRSGAGWALTVVLLGACGGSAPRATDPAGGPAPEASPVRPALELLERIGAPELLAPRGPAFTRRVALMAGDLDDPELERLVPAVSGAFAAERLLADVAAFLAAEDPGGAVDELLVLTRDGAFGDLLRISRAHEPALSLEEHARALLEGPPPDERVELVADWVAARGAGDFFVLLDQALAEAAHGVLAVLRPEWPAFRPLSGEPLFERLEASFQAAVVSALRDLEPVPDDVLRRATAELDTAAGRWWVESYQLAVARAIRAAGSRAVAALRTQGL